MPAESVDTFIRDANRIPNLQLLPGPVNVAKQASLPQDWLDTHFSEPEQREHWLLTYDAGGLPPKIIGFDDFFDARRRRLRAKLTGLLGVVAGVPAEETPDGHAAQQVDEASTLV